jgi:magnesium transporter
MNQNAEKHLQESVLTVAGRDFNVLRKEWTVEQALQAIRNQVVGEKIIYFYVTDNDSRLLGVVPTRRLLTASLEQSVAEIMITRIITIPETATVFEACEFFVLYRFLALPVVNPEQHIVGVVDVGVFAQELFDIAEREQTDEIFESLGFRVSQVREASPLKAFRFRFPWLLTSIVSGVMCAVLVGAFEMTLSKSIVLAFFLALVLGLGESVSIQSMTLTIQALRFTKPEMRWYVAAFLREGKTALLLGAASGLLVGIIVWLWHGSGIAAMAIGGSILLSLCSASLLGLTVPSLLHALKLDPKIAAGPVTLALADLCTIVVYFTLATVLLKFQPGQPLM